MRALFLEGSEPRHELRSLADATVRALGEEDLEQVGRVLSSIAADGTAWRMVPFLRRAELPPAAIRLAAGASALASPKSYSVGAAWNAAHALARGEPPEVPDDAPAVLSEGDPTEEARRDFLQLHEEELAALRGQLRAGQIELAAEKRPVSRTLKEPALEKIKHRIALLTGHVPRPAGEAVIASATAAAPIGAGDQFLDEIIHDRQLLYLNRDKGPAWHGLMLAFDACAGASHLAIDELGELAKQHSDRPWALWLHEMALTMADDPRAKEARSALLAAQADALDVIGMAAADFARGYLLKPHLTKVKDAWLLQAAARVRGELAREEKRKKNRAEDEDFPILPLGHPLSAAALRISRKFNEWTEEARQHEASVGPFYGLRTPPTVWNDLLSGVWAMLVGFRSLHGLELARGALAEVSAWLDVGST